MAMPRQTLCPVALAVALVAALERGRPGLGCLVREVAVALAAAVALVASVAGAVEGQMVLALIRAPTVALEVLV